MDLVLSQQYAIDLADDLTLAPNPLFGAKIRLFINDIQPVYGSLYEDFTPPTYTGYADKTVTWLNSSISDDGAVEVIGTVPEFRPTDSITPQGVFGAILSSSTAVMYMGGRFEGGPLPMESSSDAIVLTIRYRPIDQSIAIVIS